MSETVSERLDKYLALTKKARAKVVIAVPDSGSLRSVADDFLSMVDNYYADALHFKEQGDEPKALAAVSYAHAWLDAGARLGLFEVGNDDKLFTLSK
ncbi:MAG: DUF357 domain-containing protein [Candidatus Diapherotrites archaeon]|nr:DUF357 domain-containing protein [Candidatus Diapherotrites archaeon]